jgi:hypothetical protein
MTQTKYVAGWNMPGYLPEMEPAEFDSFEEAKAFIVDELEDQANGHDEGDEEGDAYEREVRFLQRDGIDGPFSTPEMPDGYTYWVDIAE